MKTDCGPPDSTPDDQAFSHSMRQVEDLVSQIERLGDPHARELARGLTQALLDMHRSGLSHMLAALERGPSSADWVRDRWIDDPLVGNLLVLHDLHPLDLDVRVARALEVARERLRAQGADVSMLGLHGASVHLRLTSTTTCASAMQSLRAVVIDALLERAADVLTVTWEEPAGGRPAAATFVPLERLTDGSKVGVT